MNWNIPAGVGYAKDSKKEFVRNEPEPCTTVYKGCKLQAGDCVCESTTACINPYPYINEHQCEKDISGILLEIKFFTHTYTHESEWEILYYIYIIRIFVYNIITIFVYINEVYSPILICTLSVCVSHYRNFR